MSVNAARDSETRSALEKTLNTLEQLTELKETYNTQEKSIDLEIATLELRLGDLKQQRSRINQNKQSTSQSITQMESVVQNLRSALSLMRRIPNEILILVFSIICHDAPLFNHPAPIVLSGVCSRWRSIMHSNSSLWATVRIQMDLLVSSYNPQKGAQTLKHILDRGRHPQRSLVLYNWKPDLHTSLEQLLESDTAPCRKIVINILDLVSRAYWSIGNCRATELHLHFPLPISYQMLNPFMRFSSTLLIRSGYPPDLAGVPWINLRSLTLTRRPYDTYTGLGRQKFIEILRAAPHLTELNLNIFPDGDISLPETTLLVSHPKLQVLRLRMQYFAANGVPLGVHLDAPALREVTLYSLKRHEKVNEPSFLRNWDVPTHLVLPPLEDYDVANAAELLHFYPGVEILEVEGKNIDTLFVFMHTILNQISPEADSLPLLKLSILHISDSDLRGETLLEFLDARLRHVKASTPGMRAMERVVMYETPGVTPEDWRVVNERLEEGRVLNRRFRNMKALETQKDS